MKPEIMIPLVGNVAELVLQKEVRQGSLRRL